MTPVASQRRPRPSTPPSAPCASLPLVPSAHRKSRFERSISPLWTLDTADHPSITTAISRIGGQSLPPYFPNLLVETSTCSPCWSSSSHSLDFALSTCDSTSVDVRFQPCLACPPKPTSPSRPARLFCNVLPFLYQYTRSTNYRSPTDRHHERLIDHLNLYYHLALAKEPPYPQISLSFPPSPPFFLHRRSSYARRRPSL